MTGACSTETNPVSDVQDAAATPVDSECQLQKDAATRDSIDFDEPVPFIDALLVLAGCPTLDEASYAETPDPPTLSIDEVLFNEIEDLYDIYDRWSEGGSAGDRTCAAETAARGIDLDEPAIESALRDGISALEVADQAALFAAIFECGSPEMQVSMLFASFVGSTLASLEAKYCAAETLDGSDAASAWLSIDSEEYEATLQAALDACS